MAQSKVQTNEKEKMAVFKQSLVNRVETALIPSEQEPASEKTILLLPAGYEGLTEAALYKTLTLNTQLQHTPQTAVLAIETLKTWNSKVSQVSELEESLKQYRLDLIDLIACIETTEQKIEECLHNTSSNIQFTVVEDVIEKEQEQETVDYISIEEFNNEDFEPTIVKEDGTVVYKIPADFKTMTEPQFVFNLYTKFHYTKRAASDLFAVLSNKIPQPENMEFELV